jgi:predicted alpha/beta-fold hydrolase
MPLVTSSYYAPRFLRGGHVQTVLPTFLPRRRLAQPHHERLELADGDFVDLRWHKTGHDRLAILSHGLEGSTQAIYIRSMAAVLLSAGWDVLAWNFRGCGGVENRLPRSYHSGESGDLRCLVEHAAPAYSQVALIGFSLGGNITLKYLGEQPPHPHVIAAAAVSAPVDLASSAHVLDARTDNRIYLRRFLNTLIVKMEAKAKLFPESFDVRNIRHIRTIKEFDDRYTAPLHGFKDADDYWEKASSLPHLGKLTVPSLLLNALNDPLLTTASFPEEIARDSSHLHLEMPEYGGHVGFLDHRLRGWHEQRVVSFISAYAV